MPFMHDWGRAPCDGDATARQGQMGLGRGAHIRSYDAESSYSRVRLHVPSSREGPRRAAPNLHATCLASTCTYYREMGIMAQAKETLGSTHGVSAMITTLHTRHR